MSNKHLFLLGLLFLLLMLAFGCTSSETIKTTTKTTTIEPIVIDLPIIQGQVELPQSDMTDLPIDVLEIYEGEDIIVTEKDNEVKSKFKAEIKEKNGKKVLNLDYDIQQEPIKQDAKITEEETKIDEHTETKSPFAEAKEFMIYFFVFVLIAITLYLFLKAKEIVK
jgi:hypothetical protein